MAITKRRALPAIGIPIVYIGLPLAILAGIIHFDSKFYALTGGGLVVYALLRTAGYSNAELGLTLKGAGRSLLRVLPITAVLLVAAVGLYMTGFSQVDPTEDLGFFVFYIFISSPVQEFLYRGALVAVASELKLPYWMSLVSTSLLYSFVHIIYMDTITLVFTFVIGMIWFWSYYRSRSLVGVSVSHAVLGVVTIAAGIID